MNTRPKFPCFRCDGSGRESERDEVCGECYGAGTFVHEALVRTAFDRSGLHLYENGHDTVIAHDVADARRILADLHGGDDEDHEGTGWSEVDPDEPLTVRDDDAGRMTLTGWDWIIKYGRGFLCSTEM